MTRFSFLVAWLHANPGAARPVHDFTADASHHSGRSMPLTVPNTRSMRLAGLRRGSARPCFAAAAGSACVHAYAVGGRGVERLRSIAKGTSRDRGIGFDHAGAEAQRQAQIGINSFSAGVRLGAGPG